MDASKEIVALSLCLIDKGREKEVIAIYERVKKLEDFARDIRDNYDCDEDAHKYGTTCRSCKAKEMLSE
jgi:hypothetical protein